jgi:hypothetical protein
MKSLRVGVDAHVLDGSYYTPPAPKHVNHQTRTIRQACPMPYIGADNMSTTQSGFDDCRRAMRCGDAGGDRQGQGC